MPRPPRNCSNQRQPSLDPPRRSGARGTGAATREGMSRDWTTAAGGIPGGGQPGAITLGAAERLGHEGLPVRLPPVAVDLAAPDPVLRQLRPRHAAVPGPRRHRAVARKGPLHPGLLVRPQVGEAGLAVQRLQHLHRLAVTRQQTRAPFPQRGVEFGQAGDDEAGVQGIAVRCAQDRRLRDVQGDDPASARSLGERTVVVDAQVALEPDDMEVTGRHAPRYAVPDEVQPAAVTRTSWSSCTCP